MCLFTVDPRLDLTGLRAIRPWRFWESAHLPAPTLMEFAPFIFFMCAVHGTNQLGIYQQQW